MPSILASKLPLECADPVLGAELVYSLVLLQVLIVAQVSARSRPAVVSVPSVAVSSASRADDVHRVEQVIAVERFPGVRLEGSFKRLDDIFRFILRRQLERAHRRTFEGKKPNGILSAAASSAAIIAGWMTALASNGEGAALASRTSLPPSCSVLIDRSATSYPSSNRKRQRARRRQP